MSVIVRRGRVDDGKRIYLIDDVIHNLSPDEEKQLVDNGYCHYYMDHLQVDSVSSGPLPDNLVNAEGVVLTVDEFSKLKAEEQKKILEGLVIDPASKAEERVEQYQTWYDEQVDAGLDLVGADGQ